jgi:hypothetical protein
MQMHQLQQMQEIQQQMQVQMREMQQQASSPKRAPQKAAVASLGSPQKSDVEDLLDRFVVSTLSSPESMRQARASLKRLAGLDPTPPPPAAAEIRRLTEALGSSARAKREVAPLRESVPPPPERRGFRAGMVCRGAPRPPRRRPDRPLLLPRLLAAGGARGPRLDIGTVPMTSWAACTARTSPS